MSDGLPAPVRLPLGVPGAARPAVSVVVRCCNEAAALERALPAVAGHLAELTDRYVFELLIADDASTDETLAVADAFAAGRPWVHVLRHPVDLRPGQALRLALARSRGDYVVTFDVHVTYSVDHIERVLEAIESEHAKIVVASPHVEGGRTTAVPWPRSARSRITDKLLSASTGGSTAPVTGTVRAYDGPFIRTLVLSGTGPDTDAEVLYKAQVLRARVVEIPAHLDWSGLGDAGERPGMPGLSGTSRLVTFSTVLYRPLAWFAVPGAVLAAVAVGILGVLTWDVIGRFRGLTGSLDHRFTEAVALTYADRPQSFLIGGITLVLAVQLVGLGLLAAQGKRYFEESFQLGTSLVRRVDRLERSRR